MEASQKLTEIIEQLKVANQDENEPKVSKISRLEIIFMEILQVLKTNIEDAKQRARIERTFQEEIDYEKEKRHEEFLEVLKQFVSMKPVQTEETEKKDEKTGGILDFFKNMIRGLVKTIKALFTGTLKLLGKLLKFTVFLSKRLFSILKNVYKFLRSIKWLSALKVIKNALLNPKVIAFLTGLARGVAPAILLGLGIYAAREAVQELVNRMPDYSKINYKEAESVLESRLQRDIEHFATKLPEEYTNRPGLEAGEPDISSETKLQMYVRDAKMQRMADLQRKFDREGTLSDAEQTELQQLQNEPIVPIVTETQLSKVPPRPQEGGSNARRLAWDRKYGETHNPDGTPKVQTTAQPVEQFNVTPSTVGAGRGGEAQYVDYLARQLESTGQTGAVFGAAPSSGKRSATPAPAKLPEKPKLTLGTFSGLGTITNVPPKGRPSIYASAEEWEKWRESQKPTATPTVATTPTATPTATTMATPMPAYDEGDEQPTTGPNSLAELDSREPPNDNTAYKLPEPSAALVTPTKTKLDRNPYEKDLSDEGLRNFIRQNESMRLKNDLLRMAEEYEELGRILKGIGTQPMKPVDSSSPLSKLFNDMNTDNVNLQLQNIFATATDIKPVVNNNGRTEVIPDIPLPVEASQRDDTHTLSIVLNRYKKAYV
jgi:putative sterol carrier protein